MPSHFAFASCRKLSQALLLVAGLGLSACATKNAGLETDSMTTGSTSTLGDETTAQGVGSFKRTGALAQQWNANPSDVKVGLDYADRKSVV